jgi:hypothetical protein
MCQKTWCQIPYDHDPNSHHNDNVKLHTQAQRKLLHNLWSKSHISYGVITHILAHSQNKHISSRNTASESTCYLFMHGLLYSAASSTTVMYVGSN